jgi:hypothetical protein
MVFVIYSLFVQWAGWNDDSRFDLVKVMVDEGRFEIDNYFNNTGDRSFFDGHYYSSQNPGMSFLTVPTYATWKLVYNIFFPENFRITHSGSSLYVAVNSTQIHEITWFFYPDLGFFFYVSMILVNIFSSSFFGALTVLLIYKIFGYLSKNENSRIALSVVAGFGTIIFPMSLFFIENIVSLFFAFSSFYLLFKVKVEKNEDKKLFLLSGLLSGFGIVINFFVIIVSIVNLAYIFLTRKKGLIYYILGCFFGILPLLLYNFAIFHSPFVWSLQYLDQNVWGDLGEAKWRDYNPYLTLRLLFYPEIGLFMYYPVLLGAFFGLFYFYKKFRIESILFFVIFLLNLIIASSSPYNWLGGTAIGPRYLMTSIPFLVLPVIGLFDSFNGKKILKIILLVLTFISISINFFLLQNPIEIILEKKNGSLNLDQLSSFRIIRNNIDQYYLPQFLSNGPRSKTIEGLLTNSTKIDIRRSQLQPTSGINFLTTPFGFLTFRLQTLPIAIVIFIMFIIWRKEITNLISKKYLLLIFFVIILLALDLQTINYGENWNSIYKNETYTDSYRCMSNNASIYFFSPKDGDLFLNSSIISFNKTRKLDLYLNGNFVDNYSIPFEAPALKLRVNKGENVLKLYSADGCDKYSNTTCLSFGIRDFNLFTSDKLEKNSEVFYAENWHPIYKNETFTDSYRWMSQDSKTYLFSQSKKDYILNFSWVKYNASKTLELYLNDNFIGNSTTFYTAKSLGLNAGENILILKSREGCYIPAKIESNSSNFACLSFGIKNFTLMSFDDLIKQNTVVYGDNWHPLYKNETYTDSYRWMSQDSQIYLFSPKKDNAIISFSFLGYENQTFDLIFNNKTINSYSYSLTNTTYPELIQLETGENVLSMHSHEGCYIYTTLEKTDVCLSIGIRDFQMLTKENFNTSQIMWGRNWFVEEKVNNMTYRWMNQNAIIYLINSDKESKQINLTFSVWSYHEPRTLQLLFGNYSEEMTISTSLQKVSTKLMLNPGINALEIMSKEGCDSPSRIENSTDERCLSFAISI